MSEIELKSHALAAKISVNEIQISDLDSKIKDLQTEKKKLQSTLDEFKDDLREAMFNGGVSKIESREHGILFRLDKASQVVSIDDESSVPEKFYRVKKELDKTAIKKSLQIGDDVPGASLKDGKPRLTIRTGV